MKKLREILNNLDFKSDVDLSNISINDIKEDSRKIENGDLFVCVAGTNTDGHGYIKDAIERGAACVVIEENKKSNKAPGFPTIKVKDTKAALTIIANNFYEHPFKKIKTIGITGTNGKTTTAYLLSKILAQAKNKVGMIGTVNYIIGDKVIAAKNTTPGFLELVKLFSQMARSGAYYAVMEVSSHSLDQERVRGIDFERACFTNLTQDHLDYHKNIEDYFNAKAKLFTTLEKDKKAIINIDCEYGKKLVKLTKAEVLRCSLKEKTDAYIENIKLGFDGMSFDMHLLKEDLSVHSPMIGRHNAYNILIASACAKSLGVDKKDIKSAVEVFCGAPGRLEPVNNGAGFRVFVDYAHTDDAIANVLRSLREVAKRNIIIVFGCGGDRDRTKRPKMGRIASELSDFAILTSDNPRSEDPEAILKDIEKGITKKNFEKIADRRQAIEKALAMAKKDDIVLIAGKGHESYQIFRDRTIHFDDKETVKHILGEKHV